jgi:hypothetical protein
MRLPRTQAKIVPSWIVLFEEPGCSVGVEEKREDAVREEELVWYGVVILGWSGGGGVTSVGNIGVCVWEQEMQEVAVTILGACFVWIDEGTAVGLLATGRDNDDEFSPWDKKTVPRSRERLLELVSDTGGLVGNESIREVDGVGAALGARLALKKSHLQWTITDRCLTNLRTLKDRYTLSFVSQVSTLSLVVDGEDIDRAFQGEGNNQSRYRNNHSISSKKEKNGRS